MKSMAGATKGAFCDKGNRPRPHSTEKTIILLILSLAFIITAYNTARAGGIVGWDYGYHVSLAESWLKGGSVATNFGIYPQPSTGFLPF